MRVFICFQGSCEPFHIPPDQTVGAVKDMVKDNFLVKLSDDEQGKQVLELSHGGAVLRDSWALCDVGIKSGNAIRCLIKSEQRPSMRVFNAVTRETLPVLGGDAPILRVSVACLKTVVSMRSGLPVSTFRLSTLVGVQLYDCNLLEDYAIEEGTTLYLDTWDGWVQFLRGCLRGHRSTVQSHLSQKRPVMRFQLRVALYIAAHSGHLDLASWLLERGVRAEEPVGVHPYRQWCHKTSHGDTRKCPIHVAAESGQLLILKLFITKNSSAMACRDPRNRDPLKVAIQCGQRDCVHYLANKLFSVVSLPNMSLSMRIYLQIKHWVTLGQKRAASNQCPHTIAAFKARVGDALLVDGFNRPNMSSESREAVTKPARGIKAKSLQLLPPINNLLSVSNLSLRSANREDFKEIQKKQKSDVKSGAYSLSGELQEEDRSSIRGMFTLPPITIESIPRQSPNFLTPESSSRHFGRTPRENAVYFLTIASTFTEKPWSKQLSIARNLIRKHVHSMA